MRNDLTPSDEAQKAKNHRLSPNAMWIWALLVTNMGTYVEALKDRFYCNIIFTSNVIYVLLEAYFIHKKLNAERY